MKEKKSFPELLGHLISVVLYGCIAACVITIMIALTLKFMIWVL